jgi:type I restriction enzyme S subunit
VETGSRDTVDAVPGGDYPFIIRSKKPLQIDSYSYDTEAVLTAGDGAIGEIFHYLKGKFEVHQRVYVIHEFRGLLGRFFFYYFSSEFSQTVAYGGAQSTVASLRRPMLTNFPVALPPMKVQRAIVDYLDRETAQIDAFIAKNEELITLLIERRAAVIARTVLRGLDEAVELQSSGVEWLGDVPSHWPVQRLASTIVRARNGVWGADPQGDEDDLRCVRVADFDRSTQRIHDDAYTMRRLTASERAGRTLRSGDLLLEKSGGGEKSPVGFVVLYDRAESAVCSNFVARVQLREHMDPAFWTYVHGAMYRLRLTEKSLKQSTGIQNLDSKAYFNEFVAVPPYEEQRAIAEHLEHIVAEIDTVIQATRHGVDLARERRAAVISAAVTGKTDVGVAA